MNALRNARLLCRLMLAWWLLATGIAIAAPLVHAQPLEMVCSSTGSFKLVAPDAGNGPEGNTPNSLGLHTLDCPLCMSISLPPLPSHDTPLSQLGLSFALGTTASAHIAARTACPFPPRGPPAFL